MNRQRDNDAPSPGFNAGWDAFAIYTASEVAYRAGDKATAAAIYARYSAAFDEAEAAGKATSDAFSAGYEAAEAAAVAKADAERAVELAAKRAAEAQAEAAARAASKAAYNKLNWFQRWRVRAKGNNNREDWQAIGVIASVIRDPDAGVDDRPLQDAINRVQKIGKTTKETDDPNS